MVRVAPWRRVFAAGLFALGVGAGCSALRIAKEKHSTAAEASFDEAAARVYGASLAVLPEFHLIATGDYSLAGFIEARGDWGSPAEGAFIQISVKAEGETTKLKVEAGRSAGRTVGEKSALARSVRDRIVATVAEAQAPAP